MRGLLDTNIVIELWKDNPPIVRELGLFAADGFLVSAITEAELIVGALNKNDLRKIRRDIELLEIMPLTPAIGELANELLATYTLSNRLALPDALIAATAPHHGLPLYTLNKKDFRYIAGLHPHEPA